MAVYLEALLIGLALCNVLFYFQLLLLTFLLERAWLVTMAPECFVFVLVLLVTWPICLWGFWFGKKYGVYKAKSLRAALITIALIFPPTISLILASALKLLGTQYLVLLLMALLFLGGSVFLAWGAKYCPEFFERRTQKRK